MGVRNPNSTSYVHPDEPNLLDVHKSMQYNELGEPELRVHVHGITLTATDVIISTVELGPNTLSALETVNVIQSSTPWVVTGTVVVSNFPSSSTVYQGTIPWVTTVTNWPALQYVNGTVYAVQSGTWNVAVTSLPAVSGTVAVSSLPAVTGTVTVSNFTSTVHVDNFPTSVTVTNFTSTVSVSNTVTISNTSFAVTNFPTTSTVYQGTNPWTVTGTVAISSLPEVEIKNDSGNPIPVSGNVTATISDVITVIVDEDAGANYSFNNHAAAVHRGWVMDDTMRPVVSVRVKDTGTTTADIIKIIGYEIGNNNANQSTIVYEWYEGPLTFSGAAIPAWTNLGTKIQYRIYQDRYQSNQGNTFTVTTGTHMRHSGIIIGKNSEDDEESESLYGGATPNMLTLCMKRVDNSTELDVWFAFTIKELA